jgi:putative acyl-CoA dehydrogenase
MLQHAPSEVAEAFIASRIDPECGRVYGTPASPQTQQRMILDRAWPV